MFSLIHFSIVYYIMFILKSEKNIQMHLLHLSHIKNVICYPWERYLTENQSKW